MSRAYTGNGGGHLVVGASEFQAYKSENAAQHAELSKGIAVLSQRAEDTRKLLLTLLGGMGAMFAAIIGGFIAIFVKIA